MELEASAEAEKRRSRDGQLAAERLLLGKQEFSEGMKFLCSGNFDSCLKHFEKSDFHRYPAAPIILCCLFGGDFGFDKNSKRHEHYASKAEQSWDYLLEEEKQDSGILLSLPCVIFSIQFLVVRFFVS